MTHNQVLNNKVNQIDLLLKYLPYCQNSIERDKIMEEVNLLRRHVTEIEEMTETEKNREAKTIEMTIESTL
tara:strand:+ start:420 stop:632 length:213 start_codon:yes stop_codon:yes gene_type:complete